MFLLLPVNKLFETIGSHSILPTTLTSSGNRLSGIQKNAGQSSTALLRMEMQTMIQVSISTWHSK